jgi:hypothetical protein
MTNTFTISVVLTILTCNIVDSISNIETNIDDYVNEVSLISQIQCVDDKRSGRLQLYIGDLVFFRFVSKRCLGNHPENRASNV